MGQMALGAIYVPKNDPKANSQGEVVSKTDNNSIQAVSNVSNVSRETSDNENLSSNSVNTQDANAASNNGQSSANSGNSQVTKVDDLISRVTQFEIEKNKEIRTEDDIDSALFSDTELKQKIDSIHDPALKEQFINMRKSALRGINNKFQEMALLRKELEQIKNGQNVAPKAKFVANSVDELLKDPEFIAEAQKVSGKTSELDGDESLSPIARQKIAELESKVSQMEKMTNMQSSLQARQAWNNQHARLATVYRNYNASEIDAIANDLVEGRIQATPEIIYKATKHDENVKRAYEMGRREAQGLNESKLKINSLEGTPIVANGGFVQEKSEDNRVFLQRIIANRQSNGVSR